MSHFRTIRYDFAYFSRIAKQRYYMGIYTPTKRSKHNNHSHLLYIFSSNCAKYHPHKITFIAVLAAFRGNNIVDEERKKERTNEPKKKKMSLPKSVWHGVREYIPEQSWVQITRAEILASQRVLSFLLYVYMPTIQGIQGTYIYTQKIYNRTENLPSGGQNRRTKSRVHFELSIHRYVYYNCIWASLWSSPYQCFCWLESHMDTYAPVYIRLYYLVYRHCIVINVSKSEMPVAGNCDCGESDATTTIYIYICYEMKNLRGKLEKRFAAERRDDSIVVQYGIYSQLISYRRKSRTISWYLLGCC